MLELSLHVLDIVNNSVKAGASLIEITVNEDICHNLLTISIQDNGCGMDEEFLRHVLDPFQTTRTTRKVGMGLSRSRQRRVRAAEICISPPERASARQS